MREEKKNNTEFIFLLKCDGFNVVCSMYCFFSKVFNIVSEKNSISEYKFRNIFYINF